MQKYIRITGINSGSPEYLSTGVINCSNIIGICRPDHTAFGVTTTTSQTKIVYIDAENGGDVASVAHAATSTLAESVAMANYIKSLIAQAWEQPYTEPFVTIDRFESPSAIVNVNLTAS